MQARFNTSFNDSENQSYLSTAYDYISLPFSYGFSLVHSASKYLVGEMPRLAYSNYFGDSNEQYIMGEAYDEADKEENRKVYITPGLFNKPLLVHFARLTKKEVTQMLNLGETKNRPEPHARDAVKTVDKILGVDREDKDPTLLTKLAPDAKIDRTIMKNLLTGESQREMLLLAQDIVTKYLDSWDNDNALNENAFLNPFQDDPLSKKKFEEVPLTHHINFLTIRILAESFLGIPHYSKEYIDLVYKMDALLTPTTDFESKEFKEIQDTIDIFNDYLIQNYGKQIIESNKFISLSIQAELGCDATLEEKIALLKRKALVSLLLVQGNIAKAIIAACIQAGRSEELQQVVHNCVDKISDDNFIEDLKGAEELDFLFKESIRNVGQPILVRNIGPNNKVLFKIDGRDITLHNPLQTITLFAYPLRDQRNPKLWKLNPDLFIWNRFKDEPETYLKTFGPGFRECPASGTLAALNLFKTIMTALFRNHKFTCNKDMERFPLAKFVNQFKNDYFITLDKRELGLQNSMSLR